MPDINLIPVPRHDPLDAYHYNFDNMPIEGLVTRIFLVNATTDNNSEILRESIGTQGTLSNRLNQSINPDGSLKSEAIDEALHSIDEHIDSLVYVRMLAEERNKLELIAEQATNLSVDIETISSTLSYPGAGNTLRFGPSPTIAWRLDGTQVVADTVIPVTVQHIHLYDITPLTTDDENFRTTSVNTPYNEGSLRVYVNGLRLTEGSDPIGGFYFTETEPEDGTFALNAALDNEDIIRIDFDQPLS